MKYLAGNKSAKFQLLIMRFDEIINKIVIQDGGPDTILNISVIQKTTFIKIKPYMKDPAWNKLANFQLFVLRFYEIINKTVIQDGGRTPSYIFQSFQKLHSQKYNPTWMTLQETNQRNFNLLQWDLTKISTKQ